MINGMRSALYASLLSVSLGLGLAACSVPNPCDEGFDEDRGVCVPHMAPEPDAGGDGDGDGDGDDSDAGVEPDAATEPASEFICRAGGDSSVYGRECASHADCECPASVCLPAPFGVCTSTQCMEPGKECEDGGNCLDIGPFREMASFPVPEEITHVCLP